MIYPNNYEQKIGFNDIRSLLKERCLSTLGREKVDEIEFSVQAEQINEWLCQIREFRQLMEKESNFPMQYFFDVRESVSRIRMAGTHIEENELFDLRRSLETINKMVEYLNRGERVAESGVEHEEESMSYPYPALHRLSEGVMTFPALTRRIDSIIDKYGRIKDGATMTLAGIRHELQKTEGSISRILYTILHSAQREGLVDKDAAPTLRDGRLMIPVAPGLKRRINGIVHDESSTGKTVFIEPTEVVEANNKVRELEAEERREIIRILTVFSDEVRPQVPDILNSYQFMAQIDLIRAKAELAKLIKAFEPEVKDRPHLDWIRAIHPLLALSLEKQGKKAVPLDILLRGERRVESGESADAFSVLLSPFSTLSSPLPSLHFKLWVRHLPAVVEHRRLAHDEVVDIGFQPFANPFCSSKPYQLDVTCAVVKVACHPLAVPASTDSLYIIHPSAKHHIVVLLGEGGYGAERRTVDVAVWEMLQHIGDRVHTQFRCQQAGLGGTDTLQVNYVVIEFHASSVRVPAYC